MTDDQKATIIGYAKTLCTGIPDASDELLSFSVDEVADRVMIYLNTQAINPALNRVIARVVVGAYNKAKAEQTSTDAPEREIKSMSDNGQSLTFGDHVKQYLATAEDNALFDGFTTLLARYREADCGNTGVFQESI